MGKSSIEKPKKRGFFKRIKSIDWSNPVNKWRAALFGTVGLVVVLAISAGAVVATNSSQFCKSCHEMAPEYTTYKNSAHAEAECVDCHVAPGNVAQELGHKVKSLKEVYYHVIGIPNPIHSTEEEAVLNENCQTCHSENRNVTPTDSGLKVEHQKHIDEGVLCINCHSGVAHGKVAERGLIYEEDLKYWRNDDLETPAKLVTDAERKTNMGTCIECHTKVNAGEEPYEDVEYALPMMEVPENHRERATLVYEFTNEDTGKPMKQADMLEIVSNEGENVKISNDCATCHETITTPETHADENWINGHGDDAMQNVDECVTCHSEENWVRRLEHEESYTAAIDDATGEQPESVAEKARANEYCNDCHKERPESHDEDRWLVMHATTSTTPEAKQNCYVCHDKEDPKKGEESNAPAGDLTCETCHSTGFKSEG